MNVLFSAVFQMFRKFTEFMRMSDVNCRNVHWTLLDAVYAFWRLIVAEDCRERFSQRAARCKTVGRGAVPKYQTTCIIVLSLALSGASIPP